MGRYEQWPAELRIQQEQNFFVSVKIEGSRNSTKILEEVLEAISTPCLHSFPNYPSHRRMAKPVEATLDTLSF